MYVRPGAQPEMDTLDKLGVQNSAGTETVTKDMLQLVWQDVDCR
jgi:hypothetical protein